MNIRILAKFLGGFLTILSLLLCAPILYSFLSGAAHSGVFLQTSFITAASGLTVYTMFRKVEGELNHRTGFAIVAVAWGAACIVGALPYYLSKELPVFLNALFESTSGFSGTGASVLKNVEQVDKGILLWRSMTQWLGGMGIIVFFIAILPALGLGSGQLFKAEVTGPAKDKITPRVAETARKLWLLYLAFTLSLAICLRLAGMSGFDAVNHALTTLSTGGFSTRATGIAAFDSRLIEYIIILFMFISSVNFSLHYRFLALRDRSSLFGTEFKWYLVLLGVATALLTITAWQGSFETFAESFRAALFTTVCTASSTGFTNYNFVAWPVFAQAVLAFLMIVGGMSGSTAGGIKCIRMVACVKQIVKELRQTVHPSAVLVLKTDEHSIHARIRSAIWGFLFMYAASAVVVIGMLTFGGLDLVSSTTAAFSALSNIGPALGELGPYSTYAELPALSRATLCLAMLLGRLEFYTILVLLTPEYWRK